MFKHAVALLLCALLLGGCAPNPAASVFLKQVPLNTSGEVMTVPEDIRQSLYDLSSELTADYFASSEKDNQIFSPLSLWYALGVLREGATGETLAEIDAIMKLPQGFDSNETIPGLSKSLNFMADSKIAKEKTKNGILLTNGVFFDQRFAKNIKESYWDRIATVWGAETAQVDFTKKEITREIIRQWASENTGAFIDDYEAAFADDGSAILNIYNTLYLKDLWTEPFSKLADQVFHAPQGDVTTAFMGKVAEVTYHDHAKAQAAAFAGETGLNVWFLLPSSDADPIDLLPDLQEIVSGGGSVMVNFKSPTVDIDGENRSLVELLKNKGYSQLFSKPELDGMLTGISPAVSEIKQKTRLKLDESGFKAAAVTEIGMTYAGPPSVEFRIDRPYLMVIEYQGLPLVIARIENPNEN